MFPMLNLDFAFVVGDQQSYSRMPWLKRRENEDFKKIIPLPGEFPC